MNNLDLTSRAFRLTWLHLSDIHFGAGGAHGKVDRDDILDALVADIQRMREGVPSIDQVIVSGDIAFSGGALKATEYEEAHSFLTGLGASLGLANDAILVVPGNHDIDRSVARDDHDVRRWLDELRLRGRPVDEALASDHDRARLSSRMSNYLRFAQNFGECVGTGDSVGLGNWSTLIEARDDLRVRMAGANTALLSQGDDDHKLLQLGLTQLQNLRINIEDHDVLVFVTHHPLDWLRDHDVADPRVRRAADVHLYGHVHEADSERRSRGGGNELIRVVAGAVHEYDAKGKAGTGSYGYSVGSLFVGPSQQLGLRLWPRRWTRRNAEFRVDVESVPDGEVFVDHIIGERTASTRRQRLESGRATADGPDTSVERLLWRASDRSARRLGARRTAYPLDLSIAELHARGVYVPASFTDIVGDAESVGVDHLATQLSAQRSVLILGEPGSGKSVAAYALLQRLRDHAPAVAMRVSDLPEALDGDSARTDLALALHASLGCSRRPILLIDGLDETLAEFDSSADLLGLLNRIREDFTVVVTCRRREFEDNLARSIGSDTFDSIFSIDPWVPNRQFKDFVERLMLARLLDSDGILTTVEDSPTLTSMITRPLFARMLTFLGHSNINAITNVSRLYAEYIDKLGISSDSALSAVGCRLPVASKQIWAEAAWTIFSKALLVEERFSAGSVNSLVAGLFNAQPRCVARGLSQICDEWRVAGRVWARFVHYSFFEYLVACHYLAEVAEAVMSGSAVNLAASLSLDLTPEIRHFLVDELRLAQLPGLSDALESAYQESKQLGRETAQVRIAGNLIAYVLSRVAADAQPSLRRLLAGEDDIFLQQSLLWGLCHLGDEEALTRFAAESRASAQWRAWNRGYLMYYYGDIDRREDPPFIDSDRRRPWGRTRERSIALTTAESYYSSVSPQRRYLDLYTLYDYAIWRNTTLTGDDAAAAGRALTRLWERSGIGSDLLLELQAMHAVACPDSDPASDGLS
jgi:predicted phosphodiesterase